MREDIQDVAGSIQLCAGQLGGAEAAVHAVRECFDRDRTEARTEAPLLVDASNAFNSLNREAALRNICHLCPSISTMLINTYRVPAELFIDGEVIYSREGTTQGDPMAMPFSVIATIPMIKSLPESATYADDAVALGFVRDLRIWWDSLTNVGPSFGYYANPAKTWLVTKDSCLADAIKTFAGTNVNVTSVGRPYLGTPLGSPE